MNVNMNIFIPTSSFTYRLLDSGNGYKLEQFGSNIIMRPDSNCVWQQKLPQSSWQRTDAIYQKDRSGSWQWQKTTTFKDPWIFSYTLAPYKDQKAQKITCQLRFSSSKNIGIFPEQASNWEWMVRLIHSIPTTPQILNLFAYTGAATLCAAAAGAQVCHVDASKAAVTWARHNQELSKIDPFAIRWIVDDCAKFVAREIKRGVKYDALIMDPPAFGRDHKGNIFEFEKQIKNLLELCVKILKPQPLFVIFNGYSMGYSATVLKNLLDDFFPNQDIECGELHLQEHDTNRTLPCSLVARFTGNNIKAYQK